MNASLIVTNCVVVNLPLTLAIFNTVSDVSDFFTVLS